MAPVVDRLERDYEGKVEFRLLDVDKDPEGDSLMQRFGAQYVPTFVFVNTDGSVAGQIVGEVDQNALREKLDALE
jgi:thioredoxin-like negative regulator of GroEL